MGNKQVNAAAAVAPVAAANRYTLSFTAYASCFDSEEALSADELDTALSQLGDAETWREYLLSAICTGQAEPEISSVAITLEAAPKPQNYSGSISWTGTPCELERLKESLDWFIGDRMSQYEIGDDDAGWRMFIEVGELKRCG
jgi:hypothetical protein